MCGFTGFLTGMTLVKNERKQIIQQMNERIRHRGPDRAGYFYGERTCLGFRRLSIIDLTTAGDQPLYSEDGRYVFVFNGEIYNYLGLKQELESRGYHFFSQTDSEVLVRGFEAYGEGIFARLRGMFAVAIWDQEEERLFLARDPFGIKPLYYTSHTQDGSLLFASEIKSFFAFPAFVKEFNRAALKPFLSFEYNPLAENFFAGVYVVKPGHFMVFEGAHCQREEAYFSPVRAGSPVPQMELEAYADECLSKLQESVQKHAEADVEIGSFLSGGVDSSLITALLQPKRTYSIGFSRYEGKFNETDKADALAKHFGLHNERLFITEQDAFAHLDHILYHLDELNTNPSIIPLYFLAELASREVKVVLSGEGADELFAGYDWYRPSKLAHTYQHLPPAMRQSLARHLVRGSGQSAWQKFLQRNALPIEERFIGHALIYSSREAERLLKPPYRSSPPLAELTLPVFSAFNAEGELGKMQGLDQFFWLPKDILVKADRMSMAHGLEVRVPFLDREVFKFAQSIPDEYQINYAETKRVLRRAALKILPKEWAERPKVGFPVPIRYWLREEPFYSHVKKVFQDPLAAQFFDQKYLLQLLETHRSGANLGRKIWTVYLFLRWYEQHFIHDHSACQSLS